MNILQKSTKQKNPKYLYLILTDKIKNPLHHSTPNTYIKKHEQNQNKIVPLHFTGKKTTERKWKKTPFN